MATLSTAQFQNIQLGSTTSPMASLEGMLSGCDIGGVSINSVFTVVDDIENLSKSENSNQKAYYIQDLINTAITELTKFLGTGETAAAQSEVSSNSNAANEVSSQAAQLGTQIQSEFESISGEMGNEASVLAAAVGDLESINNERKQEEEKIQQTIAEIQTAQAALAQMTNPEEQEKQLIIIQGLAGTLQEYIANIATIKECAITYDETVQQSVAKMNELNAGVFQLNEESGQLIAELSQKAAAAALQNTGTQTQATVNFGTGTALNSAAATASTNIFTGASLAPELYESAADQNGAGAVRQAGALSNLVTIYQGIGNINGDVTALTNFTNAIGGILENYAGIVGNWNSLVEPMLIGFGSANNITNSISELNCAVETDLTSVSSGNTVPVQNQVSVQQEVKPSGAESQDNAQLNNLQTPRVQLKFGI